MAITSICILIQLQCYSDTVAVAMYFSVVLGMTLIFMSLNPEATEVVKKWDGGRVQRWKGLGRGPTLPSFWGPGYQAGKIV